METLQSLNEKVIVALDVNTKEKALDIARVLAGSGCWLKVGLELYALSGLSLIQQFKELGFKIFLDLKLHDIPTTVEKTLRVLTASGVDMINVHCSGGYEMMARAAEVGQKAGKTIIGVTVLTSMGQEDLTSIGVQGSTQEQVLKLAMLARKANLNGVVSSAQEAKILREECGEDFLLVTPGIRPAWSEKNDQVRVLTPRMALEAGSSYLVVGRPITLNENPREAIEHLWD
ncbi:Orotidine-phosphate decarboxylase [Dehalobacter sp. UNSWDHB]|uniref:orotidine-5'-phosphate decarboxylase n=1 Tax=unclassified Dehalobacter TaxID=2635733 RepID=UPI00028A7DCB|nr:MULTISPECIES: orotidine-5'-phosphate decarboxylase [unclassified Dehalobacter]AFV02476.1 Orotidine 5'-phosphate decarboxylase [Dehalobacter sp. DCA]AFV05466.1 Orotidine 5'-phosphate decarboxylase [Dehalobacter sp. CF]EQB22380.1 Orotidine-phosphate decarboxylase [Dehalobacter sp. UNSWDHB]